MAAITAQMVKELREKTGAGMMDCKKALTEAKGDLALAEEHIAKSGQRKAAKSASRVAAEGLIVVANSDDNQFAAILEVNCETDFVAKDAGFKDFCQNVVNLALEQKINDIDSLNAAEMNGQVVEETRKALVAKIGENIQLRRVRFISGDNACVGSYIHGSRIGVLVELNTQDVSLGKDIAMHVAAIKPQYLRVSEVPSELLAKEKEIFTEQTKASGKPENIIGKIVEGRVNKFFNEICLMGQSFVKNPDKTVGLLLKEHNADVREVVRFEVGEGIEVVKKSFEEEVAEQLKGS